MNDNRPNILDLVEAVREFIQDRVVDKLDKQDAFYARIAVNALAIVEKELALGPVLFADEYERLRRLLNQDGSLKELNDILSKKINKKEINFKNPLFISHLRQTVMGQLSINNPRYSSYLQAIESKQ